LRAPLNILLMQAQLLRQANPDASMLDRASGAIERAAHTQAQLIEDLLDVSRIVAGKMKIDPVPTDPAAAVGAAIEAVGALAKKKSIRIESTLDPATPWVSADPIRLQQIV